MYYYKFTATTGYCGTEQEEYHKFDEKPTKNELALMAEEIAHNNAESFEYLVTGWNDDDIEGMNEEEVNELLDNYYANASCSYEEVTKEHYEEEVG